MRFVVPALLVAGVLAPRVAEADDEPTSTDEIEPQEPAPPEATPEPRWRTRIGAALTGGLAGYNRSTTTPTTEQGASIGGDLRVHPGSMHTADLAHGFLVGFTDSSGIFGPHVWVIDAGYSMRLFGPHELRGVTAAAYLDLAPSFGFINEPHYGNHHDLGGRASLAFDLQIWNFTLGAFASYRAGIPLDTVPDTNEGMYSFELRVGGAFDVKTLD